MTIKENGRGMRPVLKILNNPTELAHTAAELVAATACRAVVERGRFTIALSGGQTPRGTYELLATQPFKDQVPWQSVHVFWGDERCIPLDDLDNHWRMAHELFLKKVSIPGANVHRMWNGNGSPQAAAERYESVLRAFFRLSESTLPEFDLVILGLGDDGHTASLYPGTNALHERKRLVLANYVPQRAGYRLTVTIPVLNQARNVLFLVSGHGKSQVMERIFNGRARQRDFAAAQVKPAQGKVTWLVDQAAASGIDGSSGEKRSFN